MFPVEPIGQFGFGRKFSRYLKKGFATSISESGTKEGNGNGNGVPLGVYFYFYCPWGCNLYMHSAGRALNVEENVPKKIVNQK